MATKEQRAQGFKPRMDADKRGFLQKRATEPTEGAGLPPFAGEERAGHNAAFNNANRKQDGPPLPSPLLPRREERANAAAGSGGTVKTRPFCRPGYLRTRIFHNFTWLTYAFINSNLSFA